MNTRTTMTVSLLLLFVVGPICTLADQIDYVDYADGQMHEINLNEGTIDATIRVDYARSACPGTSIDIEHTRVSYDLLAYNCGTVHMGHRVYVEGNVAAYDQSNMVLAGGGEVSDSRIYGSVDAYGSSHITLNRYTSVGGHVASHDLSTMYFDAYYGYGNCEAYDNSTVYANSGNVFGYNHSSITVDGWAGQACAYDSSTLIISGQCSIVDGGHDSHVEFRGSFTNEINLSDNASLVMRQGTVGYISARGASRADILGGNIQDYVVASDAAEVTVFGMSSSCQFISGGSFKPEDVSLITLIGSDFRVNGEPLSLGASIKTLATRGNPPAGLEWCDGGGMTGTLTGTLSNGYALNTSFYVWGDSDIVVLPEPATAAMLMLSALCLTKRRRKL